MNILYLLVVFSSLIAPLGANASVLKGAGSDGIDVEVEPLDQQAMLAGVKSGQIQDVLIKGMKKSGLVYRNNAQSHLFVRVVVLTSKAVNGEVLGYGAHLELSLRERAFLKRQPNTYFFAPTWFKGSVTVSNPKQFNKELLGALVKLFNQFSAEYKSANK